MQQADVSRDLVLEALEQLAQYGVPAEGAARLFDVGTDGFVRYVEREIFDDLVSKGGATCKIVEGAYGSGKTHLLQLLEDSALDRGMAVVKTSLSDALGLEDWHLIAQHVLRNIELQTSAGIVRGLPRLLEALAQDGRADFNRLKGTALPHAGFARAIQTGAASHHLTADARRLLNRYLQGERESSAALTAAGVPGVKHPLSRRNAELVLKTVLGGIYRLGVPGTLLLFDETEKTFVAKRSTPTRRVKAGANLLRRLIDSSATGGLVGTAIVFAVLPDFVGNCSLAYEALGQRLSRAPRTGRVAWRSPVLQLDSITSNPDEQHFVAALVDRHTEVLGRFGVNLNRERDSFIQAGRAALRSHAGSDYRRYVVKTIARLSLDQLS